MLTIQCPKCYQLWKVPEYSLNQSVKCSCGYGFIAKAQKDCISKVSSWNIKPELKKRIKEYIREGSDIVIVIPNGDDCPKCTPYENRLFSIAGKTIGLPELESAISGGLFHDGCTHTVCAVPVIVAYKDHDREGYPLSGYNSRPGKVEFQSSENFRNNIRASMAKGARMGMNIQCHKPLKLTAWQNDDQSGNDFTVFAGIFTVLIILFFIGFFIYTYCF